MADGVEGEVERKMRLLCEEVFAKYNKAEMKNAEGEPYILKEHLKEFIKDIMDACDETESWDDEEFETGYLQFDKDGSGQIEKQEFSDFIKRYADI